MSLLCRPTWAIFDVHLQWRVTALVIVNKTVNVLIFAINTQSNDFFLKLGIFSKIKNIIFQEVLIPT